MGYTTTFDGSFTLNKTLTKNQAKYLLAFCNSRRVKRDVPKLEELIKSKELKDLYRKELKLPLGIDGEYFVGDDESFERSDLSIINSNRPPGSQPGLWCQWIPSEDGKNIEWDGNEKFYDYVSWLQYIINHFLNPWGYKLNGKVFFQGEDAEDSGLIVVKNNIIIENEKLFVMIDKEGLSKNIEWSVKKLFDINSSSDIVENILKESFAKVIAEIVMDK